MPPREESPYTMHRIETLAERRVRDFLFRDPYALWYELSHPLSAEYTHDPEPILFRDLHRRAWTPIILGERWGGAWESAWFRFSGQVPRDWRDGEVCALIDTASEALVFSADGVPFAGLTSREQMSDPLWRKGLVLLRQKAGERVELLVEAAANAMFGYTAECRLREARLVLLRRDRWDLWHDMHFLLDLWETLPDDHPRRARIMHVLNAVMNLWSDGGPENVRACRMMLSGQLSRQANASAHRVSAIGHAHIDVAWLWPLRETVRKTARTFATALRMMEEYPGYVFGASQAQLYEFVKNHYPELYRKVKERVTQGRWEVQSAMWVEADTNLAGGESLVRQLLFGKRFSRREFGVDVQVLWLPDVFGYSGALPQLMQLAGVRYFMTQKLCWNQYNKFPYHTFRWEGIDGTAAFAHFPPADTYNGNARPQELAYGTRNFSQKDRTDRWLYVFGVGDGGGGPGRHHLEFIKRAADCEDLPRVTQEPAATFFKRAEQTIQDLPVWRGELYFECHRGTLTTQAYNKKMNRWCEALLRDIELLAVSSGGAYPRERINALWKIVLLNQFHDILPGSSITWVYRDSREQYERVRTEGTALLSEIMEGIARSVAGRAPGAAYLVCNTYGWDVDTCVALPSEGSAPGGIVLDAYGRPLPVQRIVAPGAGQLLTRITLPAAGCVVLRVVTDGSSTRTPSSTVTAGDRFLENEHLRVEFNDSGDIVSIWDKEHRRQVLASGKAGNVLALYEDKPASFIDSWDIDAFYREKEPLYPRLLSMEVIARGPIKAAVLQRRSVSGSAIEQEIALYAGSRRIEFDTRVDWHEHQKMLRVSFPVAVFCDEARCEIQFGHVRRPTIRNTSWDQAKFEVAVHRWVDLSEPDYGVALLNDCKYGCRVLDNVLDLNLLRSAHTQDPEADIGTHRFRYALLPHAGDLPHSPVIREAYVFNAPPRVHRAAVHPSDGGDGAVIAPLFSVDRPNIIVETVKRAEDSEDIVVRLYEAHGSRTEAVFVWRDRLSRAVIADLMEDDIEQLDIEEGRRIVLLFRPFEIKTVKLTPA
jgi:alpha-mannosidase